jgi:hypothetical protein
VKDKPELLIVAGEQLAASKRLQGATQASHSMLNKRATSVWLVTAQQLPQSVGFWYQQAAVIVAPATVLERLFSSERR